MEQPEIDRFGKMIAQADAANRDFKATSNTFARFTRYRVALEEIKMIMTNQLMPPTIAECFPGPSQ